MHELSLTQSLLDLALRHAEQAGALKVTELNLVIGTLSSYVDESIQFCWEAISRGTLCEGSVLRFHRVPAELVCQNCQTSYCLDNELLPCPQCHSAQVRITTGDDFRLDSIEIET
jgi:hydrogenase nickel incorporation protein HypA/HybF